MRPLHIICHANCDPPGYLCTYLDKKAILYRKTTITKNELSEIDLEAISGLILMGGPHSVNGSQPWLDGEFRFIREAIDKDIPMMGVCFGAQLISKALGAKVSPAATMEAGWHRIVADTSKLAHDKTADLPDTFEAFEWHEETFAIPDGAIPIFKGRSIEHQGYLHGRVFAMQFHLEMTEHMVYEWLNRYKDCLPAPSDTVQSHAQITECLKERLDELHAVADKLYDWWLKNTGIRSTL
jgi:GMP synthase (glutamine-hydrolysing)